MRVTDREGEKTNDKKRGQDFNHSAGGWIWYITSMKSDYGGREGEEWLRRVITEKILEGISTEPITGKSTAAKKSLHTCSRVAKKRSP